MSEKLYNFCKFEVSDNQKSAFVSFTNISTTKFQFPTFNQLISSREKQYASFY